jgi:EAL domain-containing protein (putative c-di-GMP-specific phosphodiesterase class I)
MALVRGVDTSRSRQAITRGVLRVCFELDIAVIAEGVETVAERDFFLDEGVSLMQGYLFSRPAFQQLGTIPDGAWPKLNRPAALESVIT